MQEAWFSAFYDHLFLKTKKYSLSGEVCAGGLLQGWSKTTGGRLQISAAAKRPPKMDPRSSQWVTRTSPGKNSPSASLVWQQAGPPFGGSTNQSAHPDLPICRSTLYIRQDDWKYTR